jgi:uncharacterized membrane protein YphA (DoxX/SURF4 family)
MPPDLLLLASRLLLASFFVVEGVDKVRRFRFWTGVVRDAGLPQRRWVSSCWPVSSPEC